MGWRHGEVVSLEFHWSPDLKQRYALDDTHMAIVVDFPKLERLFLCGSNVTDRGLNSLRKLSNLRELLIHMSPVSYQAAQQLQAAMPGCKVDWWGWWGLPDGCY